MIQRLGFEISYLIKNAPWDTGISPKELISFLEANPPGRALDLGCGTGTNAITIALHGWQVVGVDLSSIAIWRARGKSLSAGTNITFSPGDVTKLDHLTDPFDFVLDIGCFHTIPLDRRQAYEKNLDRLLKPGGTFLLYTWVNLDDASPTSVPSESKIRQLFNSTMEIVTVEHGIDTAGGHTSAWFTLRRKGK